MKTQTVKTFEYAELSERAKQTAYNQWSNNRAGDAWSSEYRESAEAFISAFDFTSSRRNRSIFDAQPNLTEEQENLTGHRAAKYLWNNYNAYLAPFKTFSKPGKYADGKYTRGKQRTSRITRNKYADCTLTGFCGDIAALQELLNFVNKPDRRDLKTVLCNALQAIESEWEADAEYQVSREYFEEYDANEGTYTADGREISNLLEVEAA